MGAATTDNILCVFPPIPLLEDLTLAVTAVAAGQSCVQETQDESSRPLTSAHPSHSTIQFSTIFNSLIFFSSFSTCALCDAFSYEG